MGTVGVESARQLSRMATELSAPSQSAYALPSGRATRINSSNAVDTRSGRRQRTTSIFWKGSRSRPAQSRGSFSFSGVIALNHSRKRGDASTRSEGSLLNSSRSDSANVESQADFGSHATGFSSPSRRGPRRRNWKCSSFSWLSSPRLPRFMRLKVNCARKINLCRTNRPRDTMVYMVIRRQARRLATRSSTFSAATARSMDL
mmetsp:Transcript_14722/g.24402  ORF Transcript_14722/g.24402 Transcript_14722/m.24402 type:complete len:203 (-) Transcript_14722:1923-2531(-)